jgi:hypothetical protein
MSAPFWRRERSPKWKRLYPQPDWMRTLQVGDVLKGRGNVYRVVRKIARYRCGDLYSVQVVKRARSQYRSPTTILYYNELLSRGLKPAGVRVKLNKPIDARIACSIKHHFDCPTFVDQHEVVGAVA